MLILLMQVSSFEPVVMGMESNLKRDYVVTDLSFYPYSTCLSTEDLSRDLQTHQERSF